MGLLIAAVLIYYGASVRRLSWTPFVYIAIAAAIGLSISLPRKMAAIRNLGEDPDWMMRPGSLVLMLAGTFAMMALEFLFGFGAGWTWRRFRQRG